MAELPHKILLKIINQYFFCALLVGRYYYVIKALRQCGSAYNWDQIVWGRLWKYCGEGIVVIRDLWTVLRSSQSLRLYNQQRKKKLRRKRKLFFLPRKCKLISHYDCSGVAWPHTQPPLIFAFASLKYILINLIFQLKFMAINRHLNCMNCNLIIMFSHHLARPWIVERGRRFSVRGAGANVTCKDAWKEMKRMFPAKNILSVCFLVRGRIAGVLIFCLYFLR